MRRFPREPIVTDRSSSVLTARLRACEQVEVNYVEHVRLDGHEYYMAIELLDALTEGLDE